MFRFAEYDCIIANKDLPPNIKKGELGTIDSRCTDGITYLVDFSHGIDRIIDVKEEDLLPYEEGTSGSDSTD